jgi:hypothetical protein
MYGNVAVKVAVDKNFEAKDGPQVAVVFGEGGREGLPGPGNTGGIASFLPVPTLPPVGIQRGELALHTFR